VQDDSGAREGVRNSIPFKEEKDFSSSF